jgi:flavin reductase (DIM6/NTAB) family NADH-FMN oxidoreductase RutF
MRVLELDMTIDPATTAPRDVYRHLIACITPRPIGWVSTISPAGVTNLAPFSFFNGVGANPPSVVFSAVNRRDGSRKDTVLNAEATRQFVVNIVSVPIAPQMNATSAELAYEVSEFKEAGLTELASVRVRPPRVKEALVQMECEVFDIVRVGDGPLAANLVIGIVALLHADDRVLDANGQVDPNKLDTIGRMGSNLYCNTRERFEMERP